MLESLEPVAKVAPLFTPFVPVIVETYIKPKLQKLSKYLKKQDAQTLISVEAEFTEYLERSYNMHSFIPILIFQNKQRKLEDIYIPLTVRNNTETFLIDTYPENFLPKYKKVLIRDTAGMGKSTLMKRLFLSCLEAEKGIPIFIELRKLKGEDSIIDFIFNQLNPINEELDQEFILHLIKDGNFIFFLDGYDEIPQSEREKVTRNLHDFISKTGKNLFIMTSRPETSLAAFPDFMDFDIQPLKLEQAFALLRKYDEGDTLSEEIIGKLEGKTLESVKDFLRNPLLVSLLYKSYEYKPLIPLKKHIFYRQVFDALYESHDLTKEGAYIRDKYCQLDTDNFHRVLRSLGFLTLKHGIEYDKDQLLAFLKAAKEQCSTIDFKESKFLEDLLQTVPMFTKDGNNYYKWSHKSLQDYFAAQFIWLDSNKDKSNILRKMVRSEQNQKYYNVLDLYYDMDYKTFRQIIIHDYLTEFFNHYNSSVEIRSKNKLNKKELEMIKLLTFGEAKFFILENHFIDIVSKGYIVEGKSVVQSFFEKKGFILENYIFWGEVYFTLERVCCIFTNYNHLITELLYEKEENIYREKKIQEVNSLKDEITMNLRETSFSGFSSSLIIIENDFDFNHLVINLIGSESSRHEILDINKCEKMKREIALEIAKEESNSLFDDL